MSSSESKTGLALALISPFVNMAGDVLFAEVAIVVPPPAVNTGLGGRKATWNARVAAAHEGARHRAGN